MHSIFLDEFGDFSSLDRSNQCWRPICGYAGISVPAEQMQSFQQNFRKLKITIDRIVRAAKFEAMNRHRVQRGEAEFSLESILNDIASQEAGIRCVKKETKGREIFSSSYLRKTKNRSKRRTIYRLAYLFFRLLRTHDAEIVFFGHLKTAKSWRHGVPANKSVRAPEVELMRGVVNVANATALQKPCVVQIFLDHHSRDDETAARKRAVSLRENVSAMPQFQTRAEYAREVILEGKMYDVLIQPPVSVKSHWSLMIQAADWTCTLISYLACYSSDPVQYPEFKELYDKLLPTAQSMFSRNSQIVGLWAPVMIQGELPLDPAG